MMSPQYGLLSIVLAIALIAGVSDARPPKKLIGAEEAEEYEFPYAASLYKNYVHKCGGVIINSRHVLTAAHCVKTLSAPYDNSFVVTGSVYRSHGERRTIKSIRSHERYDKSDLSSPYDIALIALKTEIYLNYRETSMTLSLGPHPTGVSASVVGWGTINPNFDRKTDLLRKINTTILSYEECLNRVRNEDIIHRGYHVCASNPSGISICEGDSGGPLVYNNRLIGIASFITSKCGRGGLNVYIDVSHFVSWIQENIDKYFSP